MARSRSPEPIDSLASPIQTAPRFGLPASAARPVGLLASGSRPVPIVGFVLAQITPSAPVLPPPSPLPPVPKRNVTSIDVITGPSGAFTNFPLLPSPPAPPGCHINAPGPSNNTTTGACLNIHQIHFHLSGISSADVALLRIVERTTIVGGVQETINKSDGPSPQTVARPNTSLIVVGDCPGFHVAAGVNPNPKAFPVTYKAHFILAAFDSINMSPIAKLSYDIAIVKQSIGDPSPINTFNVTDRQIF